MAAASPISERSMRRSIRSGAPPSLWFRQISSKRNVGRNRGGGRGGYGGARNRWKRYRRGNLLNFEAGGENGVDEVVGAITVVRGIDVVQSTPPKHIQP